MLKVLRLLTTFLGVDTRALTQKIREQGTMLGHVICGDDGNEGCGPIGNGFHMDPNKLNLVQQVSIKVNILSYCHVYLLSLFVSFPSVSYHL